MSAEAGVRRLDLRADPDAPLDEVVAHLAAAGVIAYPTETVYGFGGAVHADALERLRALKRRDAAKPFLLLVPSADAVARLGWNDAARELARLFWPGALTLVLADPEGLFPELHGPGGGVAVRVSPHPVVARVLEAWGAPLTSTSANEPGAAPARSGAEAAEVAMALGGGDILVLDAGTLPPSAPSTLVDCTGSAPVVLREGSIPVGRLRCAIPEVR